MVSTPCRAFHMDTHYPFNYHPALSFTLLSSFRGLPPLSPTLWTSEDSNMNLLMVYNTYFMSIITTAGGLHAEVTAKDQNDATRRIMTCNHSSRDTRDRRLSLS